MRDLTFLSIENTRGALDDIKSRLRPCPFCGGKPEIEMKNSNADSCGNYSIRINVACKRCDIEIGGVIYHYENCGRENRLQEFFQRVNDVGREITRACNQWNRRTDRQDPGSWEDDGGEEE